MNNIRRYILLALIVLIFLCLTGCWSSQEIEEQNIYVGLAIDVGETSEEEQEMTKKEEYYPKKNLITLTIQTLQTGGGGTQQKGSPKSKKYLNTEETGDSIFQLMRQYSLRFDRPIIGHHLKVIIISSELALKTNVEKLLKFIFRDNDIRPSTLVLISNGKASKALISKKPEVVPAFYLKGIVDNQFRNNKILPPMILNKLNGIMNSGSSFLLQNVISAKGEVEFAGAGIIKGKTNKLIGMLNEHDVESLSWISGKIKGGLLKTYDKSGEVLTYEIGSVKTKIKSKLQGNDISFHVSITSEGRLIENWNTSEDPTKNEFLKEAEDDFEHELKVMVYKIIHKLQEIYHVDVAGFGNELRIEHPMVWKKVKKDWDKTFSQSEITYDVDLKITDYGSSTK
jgi:spore germination protein